MATETANNNKWVKKYKDGLGRVVRVEIGYETTTVSKIASKTDQKWTAIRESLMNFKLNKIEETIAVRELSLDVEGGVEAVSVLIGKPERIASGTAYCCPYQLRGAGLEESVKYAEGVDAVQALQLVMYMIGAHLSYLNEQCGGRLRWSNEPDFGFPEVLGK